MQDMKFSIDIHAPKEKVWVTLWQDETFREWAGIIDPGTYMVGELKAGNEVQYISAENGYGVTSLVAELAEGEYLLLRHQADTQDSGQNTRAKEWTGGEESYRLAENEGITTLTVTFGVPAHLEGYFSDAYPKALQCVKELSEAAK